MLCLWGWWVSCVGFSGDGRCCVCGGFGCRVVFVEMVGVMFVEMVGGA